MATENGIVPIPKKMMLSGMPIPVKEKTAAKGKKIALEGTCRKSRPAISHFCLPVNFDLDELGFDTSMSSVSAPPHFIPSAFADHRRAAKGRDLFSDVELDPVEEGFIVDRPSMGGPLSERFKVCLASLEYVGVVDGREGDQLDRVNLDLAVTHSIATTRSHFRPPPQPECHCYVARQNVRT
jgi:hypothetical protein